MLQGAPEDEREDGHGDNRSVTRRKVRSNFRIGSIEARTNEGKGRL